MCAARVTRASQLKFDRIIREQHLICRTPQMRGRVHDALNHLTGGDPVAERFEIFLFYWHQIVSLIKRHIKRRRRLGRRTVSIHLPRLIWRRSFLNLIPTIVPAARLQPSRRGHFIEIERKEDFDLLFLTLGAPGVNIMRQPDGTRLGIDDREPLRFRFILKRIEVSFCVGGVSPTGFPIRR
jgi:hypothetical protein